jgi:TP901 family phage tail tape measure protein
MMSNYDRTMELVTAANNSAGASQEQFDKTLDSMEAKLQKLKNAWNEFTMGLANNEILKGGIDLLTGLLETINKLTDALSGGSGLGKSIVNFMTVIGALKGGKALLSGGFSFIGKSMGAPGK